MRRALELVEIPGEHEARERTWRVVEAAFAERRPTGERRSRMLRRAIVAAVAVGAIAAGVSPPGRAVLEEIREAVGVEPARPALFSLPAPGRVLVASDAGVWVVQPDGSKRLLGRYREASWSPFGRFVVAARANELSALEPDGDVRWTLARPGVRSPRWAGTETDTRIAYIDRTGIRVVAGDGTGDGPVCAVSVDPSVAAAWKPGPGFALAAAAPSGIVQVMDLDSCVQRWASEPVTEPVGLEWSSDGTRLLVQARREARLLDAQGGTDIRVFRAAEAVFPPASTAPALVRRNGEASELVVGDRVLFRGAGELRDVVWSPDGRWVLATWPTADQWVFVRADGRRIRAVSNISEQFRSRSFPRVEGWCCAG